MIDINMFFQILILLKILASPIVIMVNLILIRMVITSYIIQM